VTDVEQRPAGGDEPPPALDKEAQAAFAYLLRATAQRPQTEAELRAKLAARDVADDDAEAAIARAKAVRAIDDAAFAKAWVADRGEVRGYGTARLRTELTRRQVPEALIDEALAGLDGRDDLEAATALARQRAQRMPAALPPETVARRLVGFLVRRGYPPALAQRAAVTASGLDRAWD
jgi:regulatory protein